MLDSAAAMADGGTRGPAVVPNQPDASWLLKAVSYADTDLQMPPDGQLPAEQIEVLRTWIAAGAVAPKSDSTKPQSAKAMSPAELAASHWAYQPPKPYVAPEASSATDAALSHFDRILHSKLTAKGLDFSPVADRATLLRRFHYDLTGLPPTRKRSNDSRMIRERIKSCFAATVDRLMSSPHFGERWARYWMDVSRYADTKGYVFQEDRQYPEAYRYRDWLIEAFNSDMPYTDFVRKQIAADLDPAAEKDLPALGFLTLGRRFLNNRHDIIDDRLDVVSRGLMGMTLACARCHDHKYDPSRKPTTMRCSVCSSTRTNRRRTVPTSFGRFQRGS